MSIPATDSKIHVSPLIAATATQVSSGRIVIGFVPMIAQYAVSGLICSVSTLSLARSRETTPAESMG
jgi:hypothetical protein